MLKRYSEQEMLDYWKGRLGISVSPAVAGYRDRTALDRKILDEVDLWYEEMLQSAPFDKVRYRIWPRRCRAGALRTTAWR